DARTIAAPLLADDEEQADALLSFRAERFHCRDLRGEDSFRVAGSAAVQAVALDAARKKRRHAIEVGREHHRRRPDRGQNVEAVVVDGLFDDVESAIAQKPCEPPAGRGFAPGGRVDVDERARQLYRIHASSSVRVSVRESRYFTITGVESDR